MAVSSKISSSVMPMRKASATNRMRSGPALPISSTISSRSRAALAQAVDAGLQPAQRLLEAFLEGAADGHHLAHALHLRRQVRVGGGELLERETRDLGHHVVDAGLEARRRGAAGDVVAQLVQRVAHGQLGRHLGDRETRGLGRQRRRPRHARVHLDHDHAAVLRVDRELHVGAAGVDADLAQDGDRWRCASAGIPCRSASAPGPP